MRASATMRQALLLGAVLAGCGTGCSLGAHDQRSFRIPGFSMEPTVLCGRPSSGCTGEEDDHVIVHEGKSIDRGDIILFEAPARARTECGAGDLLLMRVIAMGGERLEMRNGKSYVDGRLLNEPYIRDGWGGVDTRPEVVVPDGEFYVLGDNRNESCDSRIWDTLPASRVIGPVVKIKRGDKTITVES